MCTMKFKPTLREEILNYEAAGTDTYACAKYWLWAPRSCERLVVVWDLVSVSQTELVHHQLVPFLGCRWSNIFTQNTHHTWPKRCPALLIDI